MTINIDKVAISTIADLVRDTVNPSNIDEKIIAHYSLPSWVNLEPELVPPSSVKSNKILLPDKCVLVSRLNPKNHKTWKVIRHDNKVRIASTEWAVLVPKNDVPIDYLYSVVSDREFQHQLKSMLTGTSASHQRVRSDDFTTVMVPTFKPSDQKKIAKLQNTIIELCQVAKISTQLYDRFCTRLFKSWFIDFDPVKNKNSGDLPFGMTEETAALFPESLLQTSIGLVPKGWELFALGDLTTCNRGLSYNGAGLSGDGVHMYNLNSINEGGGLKIGGLKYYIGEYKERHLLSPWDIIVANTEQGHDRLLLASPALIPHNINSVSIFTQHVFRIKTKDEEKMTQIFLYYLLKERQFRDTISRYGNGTTVNMLPIDALESPMVILPPKDIMEKFSNIVSPIQEMIDLLPQKLATYLGIEKNLLPKILAGEKCIEIEC